MTKTKIEVLLIGGVVLVKRNQLKDMLGVTKQAIVNYESTSRYTNPLGRADKKKYELEHEKDIYYNLMESLMWHKNEPNHKYASKKGETRGLVNVDPDDSEYDGKEITTKNMRVAKEIESAQNERIKRLQGELELKIKKGQYISSDISDKATAQIVRIMLTELHNFKDYIPQRLIECETIDELSSITDIEIERIIDAISEELGKYEK